MFVDVFTDDVPALVIRYSSEQAESEMVQGVEESEYINISSAGDLK